MQIVHRDIGTLVPFRLNIRKNDHAVERMVASIKEFGFKIPILARSDGEVVDGHLRLKAARLLGLVEVPVICCDEWTPAQVKAFRLLVNRSATWATWDEGLLALELKDLKALDFDLRLTGFDTPEIDGFLLDDVDQLSKEKIPDPPSEPVSRLGDLWILGKNRILCGDATSPENVNRVLCDVNPVLMVTDPPYGVDYDPTWRDRAGLGKTRQTGTVANDRRVDWCDAYRLFSGDAAYVWHGGLHAGEVASNLEAVGFLIRSQIIWAKQHFALGRGDYHWQHEPCWYAVRKGGSSRWNGDRKQSTIWSVANLNPFGGSTEEVVTGHGTQKPIELMRRPILNNSEIGESVYDPFLGSGTTLIAAQTTERICCGLEIDPKYVDVIVKRWQAWTKQCATLDGDGSTFDEIAEERSLLAEVN
jgi:DNA modification methylase